MADQAAGDFVLGIDLGSNSLGWAMVRLVDGEPAGLIRAGVRIFEAGMEGDLESGREESRNKTRRDARLHRRQLWRRARRLKKTFNLLQRYGLLPQGDASTPEKRQDFINALDNTLRASEWFKAKAASGHFPEPDHALPYILRAAALDEPLEPHALGRAFYHLAQRRGFQSNRLRPAKKDDEGVVKEGISELRSKMQASGARTLGEFFARNISPSQERIRARWTARGMYEEEFQKIWEAQAAHRPNRLTPERKKALHKAIFFQRPLWFDPNSIGKCELEPGELRAPAYLLLSQRFRLLQTVNNLRVLPPDEAEMPLTPADRKKLIEALEQQGDLTFAKVRKLLGPTKGYSFNLERGGEKTLKGNRTNADFYKVFDKRWLTMTPEERDRAVEYLHAFEKPEKIRDAAAKKWNLSEQAAEKLAEISLEGDYMNLSRRGMENLLPKLEAGLTFMEARKLIYPESFETGEPRALLPPVVGALPEIRNPAVMRSLSELRKVVNGVVRQYGKPQEIHIELARGLKKSKKQRQAITDVNRENEKAGAKAAERILAEAKVTPKPGDTRKFRLAEECHWTCPYTGKSISMQALFGPEPQFDIEHIIPFSLSMDNKWPNLTLCYVPENRAVKGNKTPYQAYSRDAARYEAILDRVKKFAGDRRMVSAKLLHFMMGDGQLEEFLQDFRSRQLNDTAYASKLAKRYLGLLYGGLTDSENKLRVQASSGQATAYFRSLWKLNSVLNDGPTTDGGTRPKSRDDHRHHAVDAVVIGLTDAGMIKRLSDAAQRAPLEGRKRFASLDGPWPNFTDSVRAEISQIIVSHRVSKKVSGALHEETIYSRPFPVAASYARRASTGDDTSPLQKKRRSQAPATEQTVVRVRKPLASLTKNEVEDIPDPGVKALVHAKLNGGDPKKVFADEKNLPFFETSDGRRISIKRVRINVPVSGSDLRISTGRTERYLKSGSNHHAEVFAELDDAANEVEWDARVVPMWEAYQRSKGGKPIVETAPGPARAFKFSLAPNEAVECDGEDGKRRVLVMRKVSQFSNGTVQFGLIPLNKVYEKDAALIRVVPNRLRQWHASKVTLSPLGDLSEAHD